MKLKVIISSQTVGDRHYLDRVWRKKPMEQLEPSKVWLPQKVLENVILCSIMGNVPRYVSRITSIMSPSKGRKDDRKIREQVHPDLLDDSKIHYYIIEIAVRLFSSISAELFTRGERWFEIDDHCLDILNWMRYVSGGSEQWEYEVEGREKKDLEVGCTVFSPKNFLDWRECLARFYRSTFGNLPALSLPISGTASAHQLSWQKKSGAELWRNYLKLAKFSFCVFVVCGCNRQMQ